MQTLQLEILGGHMFVRVGADLFLLDTGAPNGFGSIPELTLDGKRFPLGSNYVGLTTEKLTGFVGVRVSGLIGADVLGSFDTIIDTVAKTVTLSTDKLACKGEAIPLDFCMGIPIIPAVVGSATHRMFFDTGAQLSYLQSDSLSDFPPAGQVTDFYPGVGQFQTETHTVDIRVGKSGFSLRCGSLPGMLGMTLMMAGTEGILSNQLLDGRTVGYFPRRQTLFL